MDGPAIPIRGLVQSFVEAVERLSDDVVGKATPLDLVPKCVLSLVHGVEVRVVWM